MNKKIVKNVMNIVTIASAQMKVAVILVVIKQILLLMDIAKVFFSNFKKI